MDLYYILHSKDLPTSRPSTPTVTMEGTDSSTGTPSSQHRNIEVGQPTGPKKYSPLVVERWKKAVNHPDFKLVVS